MSQSKIEQLHSRADSLAAAFDKGNRDTVRHLDEAIVLDREALELCGPTHHMRPVSLGKLAIHLSIRHDQFGSMQDLRGIIVLDRETLSLCPPGDPNRSESLIRLAGCLFSGYKQLRALIEEAIVFSRETLSLCPPGHPDRLRALNSLTLYLFARHRQLCALEDLEEAYALSREAFSLHLPVHPPHSDSLNNLDVYLSGRREELKALLDLGEAILLSREALSLVSWHPNRSVLLKALAARLFARYEQLGAPEDFDETIVLSRDALSLQPRGYPDRSVYLNSLSVWLFIRYEKLDVLQDLEDAITLDEEALSLRPPGHPDRWESLNNLAIDLSARYDQLGAMQDLDRAILLCREALPLLPPACHTRSAFLNRLAADLSTRYKQLGALKDLNDAIAIDRKTLSLRPPGHPDRCSSLRNLANGLSTRYDHLEALQDLKEVTSIDREVLSLLPREHPDRSRFLNSLAVDLSTQYNILGVLRDLEEAVVLSREALSLLSQEHPDRSHSLNNLATNLFTRYKQFNALKDLQEAIDLEREALSLRPLGHPDHSRSLDDLANLLAVRYNRLQNLQDLEEAITLSRESLCLHPLGHPHRSRSLKNLAIHLSARYHYLVSEHRRDLSALSDLREIFVLYAPLASISGAVSAADLDASRAWICESEKFKHSSTLAAYETYLRFLVVHLSLLPTLPQDLDILKKYSSSLAVDAFSACLRNGEPERAVELLEAGRGVFWNQLTRLHSPLDDVVASGNAGESLATEFTRLSLLIRKAHFSSEMEHHQQLYHLNLKMQKVADDIRKLPGCSHFLLPSLFSDLRRAAGAGPIIIVNSSQYGCDALIVFEDRDPNHIQLSITKQRVQHLSSTLRTMTPGNALCQILQELWDDVVSRVVRVLQKTCPLHSRIWWCPTAEFSTLPLHAAGPYMEGQQPLSALYISSYTPTLSALIHARRPGSSRSMKNVKHFVGISQANASVDSELANVERCVDAAATCTRIEGKESCVARAAEEVEKNAWVHFACRGLANSHEPFRSSFALSDGDFTIEHILRCNLEDSEFAYLSSCQTTIGDEEGPDERIHLASVMQFIGFRSVIGTTWTANDGEINKITSMLYRLIKDESGRLDHTRAAYALNETMDAINAPIDQRVLYVHVGA